MRGEFSALTVAGEQKLRRVFALTVANVPVRVLSSAIKRACTKNPLKLLESVLLKVTV